MRPIRWLLLGLSLLPGPAGWATKRGLLIEIGQYPAGRDPLSTARDTYWLTHTLRQQEVELVAPPLRDRAATAAGIRAALNKLIRQCRPGDKVIIHFGGHGTQLPDQNGDETKDHKDEALVPYDAPAPTAPNYAQSANFIRDDELGTFLDGLRAAVGPQGHVLLLIDACYSGTLSRGQSRQRTDNRTTAPSTAPTDGDGPSAWFELPAPTQRTVRSGGVVVLMAGAEAYAKQYEMTDDDGQSVGPVAYCFSQAMATVDERATYQSVFEQMKAAMQRQIVLQRPTLDGNRTARLLGGDVVLPSWLMRVTWEGQRQFRQLRGALAGYTQGSEVAVRPTRGDHPPLLGRVVAATPFESVIELDAPRLTPDSLPVRVELLRQAFPAGKLRLTLVGFKPRRTDLETALRAIQGLELVTTGADWLLRPEGSGISLYRADNGLRLESFRASTDIAGRVAAYAEAQRLRTIRLVNPAMRALLALSPVRLDPVLDTIVAHLPVVVRDGYPVLRTNQQAWFTVRNVGTLPFYFSVIDILPNADVAVAIPNRQYPASSLRLLPGQVRSFALREITEPLGLESFSVVLSDTLLPLERLVQTRGRNLTDGPVLSPLTRLLAARIRGTATPPLSLNKASTELLHFWVDAPNP